MSDDGWHAFICYSSKDEAVARAVVGHLEAAGLNCWISLRDVPPGHNYQETIVEALERAKAVIFLFSEASSGSGEIKKELSLAGAFNLPVFPLRLSAITPSGALRYELATHQWIDLFPDREQALDRLVGAMRHTLPAPPGAGEMPYPHPHHPSPAAPDHQARPHARAVAPGSLDADAVRALLAHHIGPIAKVLVEKAAVEARSPDEFCERLAAHVTAPSERSAFLKAVRTRLALKP